MNNRAPQYQQEDQEDQAQDRSNTMRSIANSASSGSGQTAIAGSSGYWQGDQFPMSNLESMSSSGMAAGLTRDEVMARLAGLPLPPRSGAAASYLGSDAARSLLLGGNSEASCLTGRRAAAAAGTAPWSSIGGGGDPLSSGAGSCPSAGPPASGPSPMENIALIRAALAIRAQNPMEGFAAAVANTSTGNSCLLQALMRDAGSRAGAASALQYHQQAPSDFYRRLTMEDPQRLQQFGHLSNPSADLSNFQYLSSSTGLSAAAAASTSSASPSFNAHTGQSGHPGLERGISSSGGPAQAGTGAAWSDADSAASPRSPHAATISDRTHPVPPSRAGLFWQTFFPSSQSSTTDSRGHLGALTFPSQSGPTDSSGGPLGALSADSIAQLLDRQQMQQYQQMSFQPQQEAAQPNSSASSEVANRLLMQQLQLQQLQQQVHLSSASSLTSDNLLAQQLQMEQNQRQPQSNSIHALLNASLNVLPQEEKEEGSQKKRPRTEGDSNGDDQQQGKKSKVVAAAKNPRKDTDSPLSSSSFVAETAAATTAASTTSEGSSNKVVSSPSSSPRKKRGPMNRNIQRANQKDHVPLPRFDEREHAPLGIDEDCNWLSSFQCYGRYQKYDVLLLGVRVTCQTARV